MAYQRGVLGSNKRRSETIATEQQGKEKFYVIFMRGLGKVHTMRVSARYLLVFTIFLLCFIVLSVIVINKYMDLLIENKTLHETNVSLSRLVKHYKLKSQLAAQYQLLVEELNQAESNRSLAPGKKNTTALAASRSKILTPKAPVEVNVRRSKKETAAAKDKRPPVSVSDLVLHPDELNHSISFSFNLRKLNEKIDLVSGYLIIVLKSRQINPPRLVVFPSSIKIINGAPSNFRRGQQFAIRYGKMVKGVIKRIKNPKSFNTATIFAYSFQGELLLKKTIVVSDVDKTS